MLIINKPRLPPIHLNRPTAAFEPDSAAPRLVLRLQWACFGGLVGRLGLLMIVSSQILDCESASRCFQKGPIRGIFALVTTICSGLTASVKRVEKICPTWRPFPTLAPSKKWSKMGCSWCCSGHTTHYIVTSTLCFVYLYPSLCFSSVVSSDNLRFSHLVFCIVDMNSVLVLLLYWPWWLDLLIILIHLGYLQDSMV